MSDPRPPRDPRPHVEVDARGLLCPAPVIALARAAKAIGVGTIRLLADDPAAEVDVPAWCELRGAELVGIEGESAWTGYVIRVGWPAPSPDGASAGPDRRPQ